MPAAQERFFPGFVDYLFEGSISIDRFTPRAGSTGGERQEEGMRQGSEILGDQESGRLADTLRRLLSSQLLAVLCTSDGGRPYCNLIAFVPGSDLGNLFFATARATRKFSNMEQDPRVSLLIDNRGNRASDFRDAMAVTATGSASETPPEEEGPFRRLFLGRHPGLEEFVSAPGTALMRVRVERYYVVHGFRNVVIMCP